MRTKVFDRRAFLLKSSLAAVALMTDTALGLQSNPADSWSSDDLLAPAELVRMLSVSGAPPQIICVTFPFLYRQKHIPHAALAGPTNKQKGLDALRRVTNSFNKKSEIILYCGCCPMTSCPNIRPAYRELKDRSFTMLRVLNLPTNFHTDWVAKGYPLET
ncbi:MAG: rhodanese-like domain-containing protein [Acidobacteriota bacterium]|nr:rhodanese-like domain-containing protein [Acidobacteriota bacterium]